MKRRKIWLSDYMKVRAIDYKGDEVKVAQQTSWANVAPALPDEVGSVPLTDALKVGSVPLMDVVSKGCLRYVTNFEQYLLPEADQMRVRPPNWCLRLNGSPCAEASSTKAFAASPGRPTFTT